MQSLGIGDLASSLLSRRNNSNLKNELVRLTEELSSGRVADISSETNGNLAPLASMERSLALLDAYSVSSAKAELKLQYQQAAFDALASDISSLGPQLLTAAEGGLATLEPVVANATQAFGSAVSALSANVGGVYVFSGLATDTPPLESANDMLEELRNLVASATTAADFSQLIDDWFNIPGGFDLTGYKGAVPNTSGIQISETDDVQLSITASNAEIRNVLKDLAIVSLMGSGGFAGSDEELVSLGRSVGASSVASNDGLVQTQAKIGLLQQRVEQVNAQNAAHKMSLMLARNDVTFVDPFETATKLEEVQFQLESLYLVTAKTARLNLTEYLR